MPHSTETLPKKNYAIMRVERIKELGEMRRVDQHNTREKLSENIEPGGPAPRELLPNGPDDVVAEAHARMAELGLDLAALKGAVGVEVNLTTSPAWWVAATPDMEDAWIAANIDWLQGKFGRALLSIKLHTDEKTPHIHAVALAAVCKKDHVRGPKPTTEEGWRRRREEEAKRGFRWRWNYRDLFGQDFDQLSREQDRYHATVAHLGLERGERRRELEDVVLDNGVVIPAARLSRGKRKDGSDRPRAHFTTQQYQAETRQDRKQAAELLREAEESRKDAAELKAVAERAQQRAEHEHKTAAEARNHLEHSLQAAEDDRRALHRERIAAAEEQRKQQVELEARDADIVRREEELSEQERRAKQALEAAFVSRSSAERARADLDAALQAAAREREIARADAETARQRRLEAEAEHAAAIAAQGAAVAAQRDVDERRAVHGAQLALLARATNDDAGLGLRLVDQSFAMNRNAMSTGERLAYERKWPASLTAVARHLARALERARDLARRLLAREKAVEAAEAALVVKEAAAHGDLALRRESQQREYTAAMADLDRRARQLEITEARAAKTSADAQVLLATMQQNQADTKAMLQNTERWLKVLDINARSADLLDHAQDGSFALNRYEASTAPDWIKSTLRHPAPPWAKTIIQAQHRASQSQEQAERREREAGYAVERLEEILNSASGVMTPAQEAFAHEARQVSRSVAPWRGELGELNR